MSEYTPTTDQVRAVFIAAPGHHTHAGSRHEAFERWLASITYPAPRAEARSGRGYPELYRTLLHNHSTTNIAFTGLRPAGECSACDFARDGWRQAEREGR